MLQQAVVVYASVHCTNYWSKIISNDSQSEETTAIRKKISREPAWSQWEPNWKLVRFKSWGSSPWPSDKHSDALNHGGTETPHLRIPWVWSPFEKQTNKQTRPTVSSFTAVASFQKFSLSFFSFLCYLLSKRKPTTNMSDRNQISSLFTDKDRRTSSWIRRLSIFVGKKGKNLIRNDPDTSEPLQLSDHDFWR